VHKVTAPVSAMTPYASSDNTS